MDTHNVLGRRGGLDEPIVRAKVVDELAALGALRGPGGAREAAQEACGGAKVLPRQCRILL